RGRLSLGRRDPPERRPGRLEELVDAQCVRAGGGGHAPTLREGPSPNRAAVGFLACARNRRAEAPSECRWRTRSSFRAEDTWPSPKPLQSRQAIFLRARNTVRRGSAGYPPNQSSSSRRWFADRDRDRSVSPWMVWAPCR